jgi:SOS-response transcriptional repressor LexA
MTIGSNIRRLRKAQGWTILELANQVNSDVGNISRLERDQQGYSHDLLTRIATALTVEIAQIFREDANVEELASRGRVPLLSWVAAGSWCETDYALSHNDAEQWLVCPVKHGANTYALKVKGDSMYNSGSKPSFHDGDIIFVDPDRAAINHSLVIAKLADGDKVTFKRLLIDGDQIYLEALNPSWPNKITAITANSSICGVVIARFESFL